MKKMERTTKGEILLPDGKVKTFNYGFNLEQFMEKQAEIDPQSKDEPKVFAKKHGDFLDLSLEGYVDFYLYRQVKKELLNNPAKKISVDILSYGGSAYAGFAVYNLLKNTAKEITTSVNTIAASAAGLIIAAGDERKMPKTGAQIMLHNSWAFILWAGNWKELKAYSMSVINALVAIDADILDIVDAAMPKMERNDIEEKLESGEDWYLRFDEAFETGLITGEQKQTKKDLNPQDFKNSLQDVSKFHRGVL